MTEPEFRCRETTAPPHGYRPVWRPPTPSAYDDPVWPPPPPRAYNLPPGWWARLCRRLRGLLARPLPRQPPLPPRPWARAASRSIHPAEVARILALCSDREQGEEP